ncbi:tetratricopeptide repeat protein, partial [Streptomyces nigra]
AIREAVHIRRSLADAHPETHYPTLALSLNNLALYLSHVGRHDEALLAITEAVDLCRALSAANPDAFLPSLADSLSNLAAVLRLLGRRAEASEAGREAEGLRNPKSTRQPPDVGTTIGLPTHLTFRDPGGGPTFEA